MRTHLVGPMALLALCGCTAQPEPAPTTVPPTAESESPELPDVGSSTHAFPEPVLQQPYSPLAIRTNRELLNSASQLLDLSEADRGIIEASVEMPEETVVRGLTSITSNQQVTDQLLDQFSQVSDIAAGLYLGGDVTLATFNERVGCADETVEGEQCVRDRAIALMTRGFNGSVEPEDIEALDRALVVLDELLLEEDEDGAKVSDSQALDRLVFRFRLALRATMLHPKFLLQVETGIESEDDATARPLTDAEIATRIAFLVTGSPPDASLMQAAAETGLRDPERRREQVRRLLATEASIEGVVATMERWLDIKEYLTTSEEIGKNREFLRSWVAERRPFEDFYTAPVVVHHADGSTTEEAFGIFGQQAFVAAHSNDPVPSFINRGEFITETMLCADLPEEVPDAALTNVGDALSVFNVHAKTACATCHHVFDNYGAAFQRYDLVSSLYTPGDDWLGGEFELYPIGDISGVVTDPGQLGAVVGASTQAKSCMAKLWMRHSLRREFVESGADELANDELVTAWLQTDTSIASLIELIVVRDDFAMLRK